MAQPMQPSKQTTNVKEEEKELDIVGTEETTVEEKKETATTATKKKLPPHYLMTIEGTALISGKEEEYQVEIKVPDLGEGKGDGHYMTFVLSSDNGDLLASAIRKKYKNCESVRLHTLVERVFVDSDGSTSKAMHAEAAKGEALTIGNMRKSELISYIKDMKYPIDIDLYSKADEMRDAISLYQSDKELFLEKQLEDQNNFRIKKEAALLNN